ncbi:MAG: BolA family transcriptional regulator [Gammaproteobacteria bacterium]|nr:BolA family transcriptional regulator [Gammaproteobacteria bacterium]
MGNQDLENTILSKLSVLAPSEIKLIDESRLHVGHAGVKERGGCHYHLLIASPKFHGLTLINQHKLIYATLGDLIGREIHALRITIL